MAYATANLRRIAGDIDNYIAGSQVWAYSSSDADSTVKGANYFADAYAKGVKVGDTIFVNVVGTGLYIHSVLSCTASACTVTQTPATST